MLFFATKNGKQPKITYLQHVSFTFIFFPFDVSFCFFSCFLFSFSFFSLVISALRAFLFFLLHFPFFSSRSLFPTRFNHTLPPPRRILFLSRFRRFDSVSPCVRYLPPFSCPSLGDRRNLGRFRAKYCSFCRQNPGRDQIFCLTLFHLYYFY